MTTSYESPTLQLLADGGLFDPNGTPRHLMVRVQAPVRSTSTKRAAISVALVIDRSGSMNGRKFENAKQAVWQAMQRLTDQDIAAVVAYDDDVLVLLPSGPMTADRRMEIRQSLGQLATGGGTNMISGWLTGCAQADVRRDGRLGRCLLLTDGLANVGVTDPATISRHAMALRERGIVTSTFGVGDDFDEMVLVGLAESGGGNFHDIATGDGIPAAIEQELGKALEVACADVQLVLTPAPGMSLTPVSPWYTGAADDHSWTLRLPDLVHGQQLDIPFRVAMPSLNQDACLSAHLIVAGVHLPMGRVTWHPATVEQVKSQDFDPEVIDAVAVAMAAQARREALANIRDGDAGQARRRIREASTDLASLGRATHRTTELVLELEQEERVYSEPMARRELKSRMSATVHESHGRTRSGQSIRLPVLDNDSTMT